MNEAQRALFREMFGFWVEFTFMLAAGFSMVVFVVGVVSVLTIELWKNIKKKRQKTATRGYVRPGRSDVS